MPTMRICIQATVNDERGVHARPSALIVRACKDYPGMVTVSRADDPESPEYDCKAMMALIEMEAAYKTRLRFCVEPWLRPGDGRPDEDEQKAKALCDRLVEIVSMTLEDIERLWP
jgi:phosphotransferase system HPr (HPr) family protein